MSMSMTWRPGNSWSHQRLLRPVVLALALLVSWVGVTWWAVTSISEQIATSDKEVARHARQRALVASLQEQLVEVRRVESALLRHGAERAAGHRRWDTALSSARRTLRLLGGLAGSGERVIVHQAQQQLESYGNLMDKVWLPPGTAGAPLNPAPLVARASDHMIGLLQNSVHLGVIAGARAEVSQEAARALMRSFGALGTTFALWLLGTAVLALVMTKAGVRPLLREFERSRSQPQADSRN